MKSDDESTAFNERERAFMRKMSPKNVEIIVRSVAGLIATIIVGAETALLSTNDLIPDDIDERVGTFTAVSVILFIALPRLYRTIGERAAGARLRRAATQLVIGVASLVGGIYLGDENEHVTRTLIVTSFVMLLAALDLCAAVAFGRRGLLETANDEDNQEPSSDHESDVRAGTTTRHT